MPADEERDERRLVTALFADISGFTTLADRLDEEALHAVIAPVIAGLAGVAERYEGFIAKYAGDALLVFFGAPIAHEDDAVRALHVAAEMHRTLPGLIDQLPPDAQGLELHIGVNSGRVISGQFGGDLRSDYSILGDAVNVAQRLESVAPSGETYIGRTTYDLTREHFDLEWVGDLTVKGKPEPVAAWRLAGTKRTVDVGALGSGFIGREAELAAIEDVLGTLREGSGGVVVVNGQPGVGKSRLTDEARRRFDDDVWWMEGRCVSYGADLAYWPYIDLLRRAFGIRIEDDPLLSTRALAGGLAVAGVAGVAPYFTRLLGLPAPAGQDDFADLEPEAFRRGLHDAFETWVRAMARVRPVVLALEDVHWVDHTSADLTRELRALCEELPVAFYLTSRPRDDSVVERMVDGGHVPSAWLELRPFRPADAVRMVETMLDAPVPPALRETIVERTAGNPFFVRELVRSLVETGALSPAAGGHWTLRDSAQLAAIPPTIEGVLSARVDLLPRSIADVLQIASVIGRRVDMELLRLVAEDVPDLTGAVERLVAAGFFDRRSVEGVEVVSFHHALVVDVAYNRMVARQRRELHRRVAEAAEVVYGAGDDVIDLLAREYYLAGAGVKAVDYLQRAGARAKSLFANDEAVLHLSRAVELARQSERLRGRRIGLILDLADTFDLMGSYDDAATLYTEARDAEGHVRAWQGLASITRRRGDITGALAILDLALVDPHLAGADVRLLQIERVHALVAGGDYPEAIVEASAALERGDRNDQLASELLMQLARAEISVGRLDDAIAHALEARAIFASVRDLRGLTAALRLLGSCYTDAQRYEDVLEVLAEASELAERTGAAEERAACLVGLGVAAFFQRNFDVAVGHYRRALDQLEAIGHVTGLSITHVNLACALTELDDLDDATAHCEIGMRLAAEVGGQWTLADAHKARAEIELRRHRPAGAAREAEKAADLFALTGDHSAAADALELAARAYGELGDASRADDVRARLTSLA